MNILRRIKRRIEIIWSWLPIIWNDYDWCYSYIFKVLRHKIKRTRQCIEAEERHVGWEDDARDMRVAEKLLERMIADEYNINCHWEKTPQGALNFCECERDAFKNCWEDQGNGTSRWRNPFCEWCRNKEVMKTSDSVQNQDYEMLFNLLRRKIRRWWN